jgi:recombination protein RecR
MERLVQELERLPTIGPKSALRLAWYILRAPREDVERLSRAILKVKERVGFCKICNNITEDGVCYICRDQRRRREILCVVEQPKDLLAIERTGEFRGIYHVLMGVISPLEGIGPTDLRIKGLIERLSKGEVKEVLIATNPDVDGEATALYLSKLIKPLGIKASRLARGIPVGGELEYASGVTVAKAIEGRREM